MSNSPFATGQCLCGSVTFKINAEPARMAQCHCKSCQRSSGTGHMSLAFFPEDAVEISGSFSEFADTAESGNVNTRGFCSDCGSRLFGRNTGRPGVMAVAVGSVDDNSWFTPGAVVYDQDKPHWDQMDAALPKFDKMPPPPPKS